MYVKKISYRERALMLDDDEYVPLVIRIGDPEGREIYLRYISDNSLLELGISSIDGTLTSIKIVQANGYSVGREPLCSPHMDDGLPQFDTLLWKGKELLDIERPIDLILVDDSVLLVIDKNRKAENVFRNQTLQFAVADGYPCWVRLDRVNEKQMLSIRSAIEQGERGGYL